jgi:hypothetical protein
LTLQSDSWAQVYKELITQRAEGKGRIANRQEDPFGHSNPPIHREAMKILSAALHGARAGEEDHRVIRGNQIDGGISAVLDVTNGP